PCRVESGVWNEARFVDHRLAGLDRTGRSQDGRESGCDLADCERFARWTARPGVVSISAVYGHVAMAARAQGTDGGRVGHETTGERYSRSRRSPITTCVHEKFVLVSAGWIEALDSAYRSCVVEGGSCNLSSTRS